MQVTEDLQWWLEPFYQNWLGLEDVLALRGQIENLFFLDLEGSKRL